MKRYVPYNDMLGFTLIKILELKYSKGIENVNIHNYAMLKAPYAFMNSKVCY